MVSRQDGAGGFVNKARHKNMYALSGYGQCRIKPGGTAEEFYTHLCPSKWDRGVFFFVSKAFRKPKVERRKQP